MLFNTPFLTGSCKSVVKTLKSVFSRHGIPETLRSDKGPQFSSLEFSTFAKQYQFVHITSSPHYPTSNGQAERAVQTVTHLLENAMDPSLALLSYRATPLPWCGISPAELLRGRKICSNLPLTTDNLVPQWPYLQEFKHANEELSRKRTMTGTTASMMYLKSLTTQRYGSTWRATMTVEELCVQRIRPAPTPYKLQVVRFAGTDDY